MDLCSRCHKRIAVVFISKLENDKMVNEGICIRCAKDMGIKQVEEIMNRLGVSDEDLDSIDNELGELIETSSDNENNENNENNEVGRAQSIDFKKLFGKPINSAQPNPNFNPKSNNKQSNNQKEAKSQPKRKYLDQYCLDLTKKAKDGKLDNIIGRERELSRLIQILCRRQKNNPCLIGEPGVGKTAIAEALAQKIANDDIPYKLRGREVQLLDLTALVAGTQFRGQFESRMKGLIEEVKTDGKIILVIDEVHSIVGAGDAEGSMNAANIIKPALSRGDIQVIGATTLTEYRKYIEKDAALERRFQPIIIEEPSIDDSVKILEGIKGYYESFHGIKIPSGVVSRAVTLSERYISDRFLPDKAIDLLDEASAYVALNTPIINEYENAVHNLAELVTEREELEADDDIDIEKLDNKYRRLAEIKAEEIKLSDQRAALLEQRESITLTEADLAKVIEIWTGVPASNITEHEFSRIDKLDTRLKERIIGQDKAVDAVTRAIKRSRAGVSYKRKPVSFIFAGPTGVGKTELVKTLAADLFDSPETLIRLDMSEFMEKHSVSRIIGAPPGYIGYDEAGQLTEKIRRKPYSVILFDEIEKAHPDVLNVLLQILDDGIITDAHGKQVNFENTVVIMTTNAGSNLSMNTAGFGSSQTDISEDRTQKALSEFLRPEFINRVDEVITFRSLDENDFVDIAKIMLSDLKLALEEKPIKFGYSDDAVTHIAKKSFSQKYGARNMRRYIQTNVEDEIANRIISGFADGVNAISLTASSGGEKLIIDCV